MGMIDFFQGIAVAEDRQLRKAELKRYRAQEKRMIDMMAKYTDIYQRGRTKVQVINVINDIDAVLGGKRK